MRSRENSIILEVRPHDAVTFARASLPARVRAIISAPGSASLVAGNTAKSLIRYLKADNHGWQQRALLSHWPSRWRASS